MTTTTSTSGKSSLLYAAILLLFFAGGYTINAQNVAISDVSHAPDPTALLDLYTNLAPYKGLLIPRVSLISNTDIVTISSPAPYLLVFNTNASMTNGWIGFWWWNSTSSKWDALLNAQTPGAGWMTSGNAGTSAASNYCGTTDGVDFVIGTVGTERMRVLGTGNVGNVGIGTTTPYGKIETFVSGTYSNTETSVNGLQTSTGHASGTDYTLYMGADKTNDLSYLQSRRWGTSTAPLVLNANGGSVGIGTSTPAPFTINSSIFSVGAGATSPFQVNSSGNLIYINGVSYTWPAANPGATNLNYVLQNTDGLGTLAWSNSNNAGQFDRVYFWYTGADQKFKVPPGITTIFVKLWGGGGGPGYNGSTTKSNEGGTGAYVSATLTVTPGQVITVLVGGGGSYSADYGVYGGGGAAMADKNTIWVGDGGGLSALQYPEGNYFLIAGGGGGGAGYYYSAGGVETSGYGSGGGAGAFLLSGSAGTPSYNQAGEVGGGGTQGAGGSAGAGGSGQAATAGFQYNGGLGGYTANRGYGGGGGGGWYGGGGGGAGSTTGYDGGGGGGSSYSTNVAGVTITVSSSSAGNTGAAGASLPLAPPMIGDVDYGGSAGCGPGYGGGLMGGYIYPGGNGEVVISW